MTEESDVETLMAGAARSSRQARAERRRRRARWSLARAIIVAAGIGGAAAFGAFAPSTSSSPAIARPVSQHELSTSAIAKQSDPAIVDITTMLTNGEAAGSGIVLSPNGEILTNYHVVEGASSISVRISNSSKTYTAKVIGTDATKDIAVIKARGASGLATLKVGRSSKVGVGDRSIAIGNALNRPGPPTVTEGAITALHRSITVQNDFGGSADLSNLLETDARLEPGNSGGPLFNASGKVIGINTAVETARQFSASAKSDGYAIPIDDAMAIVRQIEAGKSSGKVQVGPRGYLGVQIRDPRRLDGGGPGSTAASGALVVGVEPRSAADSAGIVAGDVIMKLDGTAVGSASELTKTMQTKRPGDKVNVVWTDASGQPHTATVKLGVSPIA